MQTSEAGVELIKNFEGLELEAYRDFARGVWTIGYGHTSKALDDACQIGVIRSELASIVHFNADGKVMTTAEKAEALLRRDLISRESAVSRLVNVDLNQNEFDALVSFVYNLGAAALKRSTALKRLHREDRIGAAKAMTWWNKAEVNGAMREVLGLTRRRNAEAALFLTPANDNAETTNNPDAAGFEATQITNCPAAEAIPTVIDAVKAKVS